jgi:hypothetical protein
MEKLLSEWFRMFKKDAASLKENPINYKLKLRRQLIQNNKQVERRRKQSLMKP